MAKEKTTEHENQFQSLDKCMDTWTYGYTEHNSNELQRVIT